MPEEHVSVDEMPQNIATDETEGCYIPQPREGRKQTRAVHEVGKCKQGLTANAGPWALSSPLILSVL